MAERADEVPVRTLDWPVPVVQHLWLGTGEDDKAKRRRAFLSCLNCENFNASKRHIALLLVALSVAFLVLAKMFCCSSTVVTLNLNILEHLHVFYPQ